MPKASRLAGDGSPAADAPVILDTPLITDAVILDTPAAQVAHRDLRDIAPTDPGGIVINRTKSGISPYVPIVKTPNYAHNSGNFAGYSVEIEDDAAPTGYRHLGNVSKDYLLLPNEEVRRLALEIAEKSGLPFKESRVFWDGARFCHVIDFLGTQQVEDGDEVGLGLITRSSYDRSWRYECALMGKRFVCDNGALSGEAFARVSFKHLSATSTEEDAWKEVVRQGLAIIQQAPQNLTRFTAALRAMKALPMTDTLLRDVWRALPATLGEGVLGQIMGRYVAREEATLYGLFNAGTNVFWHRDKMTAADFANNDAFTTRLLAFATERRN